MDDQTGQHADAGIEVDWSAGVAELARGVVGPVLRPGDTGYDEERGGFNLTVDHRPAVVVGATCPGDVQAAVGFAASRGMPVAVQATGHGVAVPADDAVLISTRRMVALSVDPERASARVEAGTRWDAVIAAAAEHGLAPLNGSAPHLTAIPYTLGGGLGPIGRTFGYAADHVTAVEVVTADGQLRRVDAATEPDLFWALRGGKGNFGVATALEFDLMPVTRLYGGGLFFSGELVGEVLRAYHRWTRTVPETMSSSTCLLRFPDVPEVPELFRGQLIVHVRISYVGSVEEGERLVAPLRDVADRLLDTVTDMPYADVGSIHSDPTDPGPYREATTLLRSLDDEAVETIVEFMGPEVDTPLVGLEIRHLGGALARPPATPNAVGNRGAAFTLHSIFTAEADEVIKAYSQQNDLMKRLASWSTGGRLLNFLIGDQGLDAVRSAYDTETYERLMALKTTYDPENTFRLNHNIPPR